MKPLSGGIDDSLLPHVNVSAERADTIAIKRGMTRFDGHSQVWLFG